MAKQVQSKLVPWLSTVKDDRVGKAAVIAAESGMELIIAPHSPATEPKRQGNLQNCYRMVADLARNLEAHIASSARATEEDARQEERSAAAAAAADAAAEAMYQSNTDDSEGPISRGARRAAIATSAKRRRIRINDATPTPSPPKAVCRSM
jgi:hypothetical protein